MNEDSFQDILDYVGDFYSNRHPQNVRDTIRGDIIIPDYVRQDGNSGLYTLKTREEYTGRNTVVQRLLSQNDLNNEQKRELTGLINHLMYRSGGRKARKSRKAGKSRKTRKTRKMRKSR